MTMEPIMIRTRILILSDTHSALPQGYTPTLDPRAEDEQRLSTNRAAAAPSQHENPEVDIVPFTHPLPSADVLLHCGDLTMNGSVEQHARAVALLKSIDAPLKIVIPGNHDITLDRPYYDTHPNVHASWPRYPPATLDMIRDMYVGEDARRAGIRYFEEGLGRFVLRNGARLNVYASAWQPEFWCWAFGYPRGVDRFNPGRNREGDSEGSWNREGNSEGRWAARNPVPDFKPQHSHGLEPDDDGIDIMLTHGPPLGILDTTYTGQPVGCEHLRQAVQRCRPRLHCFGHIHEAWGAVRKTWDAEADSHEALSWEVPQREPWDMEVEGEPEYTAHESTATTINPIVRAVPSRETQVRKKCIYLDATDLHFGKETVFVNASIMDLRYKPVNAPWLVDLMLPAASPTSGRPS